MAGAFTQYVSIRARLVGRAMRSNNSCCADLNAFQSAPGWLAGRCTPINSLAMASDLFQSAPGWLAGRCRQITEFHAGKSWFQSAPGWLAGRCPTFSADNEIVTKFQSAPGWLAGRCVGGGQRYDAGGRVSIRARLVGRAMLDDQPVFVPAIVFQSAPGWLAGRCLLSHAVALAPCRFNPRPAGWPGDACAELRRRACVEVLIRARLVGRAMRQYRRSKI